MGEVLFLVAFTIGVLTLFFIAPLTVIVYFIANLVNYIKTPPEEEQLKKRRKIILIINTILLLAILPPLAVLVNYFAIGIGRM